jgi:class 3 adenylate cyclase/tetratricopeptide (TPR) repeat protein
MDVANWLRALGLERYEATFRENDVDAELLPNLAADDLKELGITSLGHRRRLLEAIAALRLKDTSAGNPVRLSISPTGSLVKLETTAERRPLSVMFCDLIGSTALSSRLDPEDLRDVIRTYQACVATTIKQLDGFIARYVGDGVLIYFGWPEARETDAERAVRAGLAVASAVSEVSTSGETLQVRIGIATGVVVIGEPIGSGDSRQQTAVGETPNLAARLQGLAGPNQVVIDATTRRQIGGLFECQDLGTVELKGLTMPVPTWQVVSENRTLGQFEALRSGATPLVGRDEEMELLLLRWAQAKAGNGRVVLISAEAGVGKSRLAEAVAARIAEAHAGLRFFCSPHQQDSALYPVVAQMERAAGFVHADGPAARVVKLQALLAATASPIEDVALIADLHSLPSADLAAPSNVTPQRKKKKTFEALLRQLEGLSRRQPVLMIFDDIHWIDPSSREFLDRLIERIAAWPVLLLAMFRPEFHPPWIGQPQVTMLTLARLDRDDTAAMVANVAGNAALPPEIMEEIAGRADGVPLFIEELTKAVLESGGEGAAALSSVRYSALSVPATLHASLMARLDRLGPAAREVAQTGAAIGREFGFELLASITDFTDLQLGEALDRLTNSGLLFIRGTPPESSYVFKHALVQDAAYGTLLRGRRQRLHGHIAAMLEARFPETVVAQPALLAQHCAEAREVERAVDYSLKAAHQALARSAMLEAEAQLGRGLRLLADLPDGVERRQRELDLQSALIVTLMQSRGYAAPAVAETLSRARQLCEQLDRPQQSANVLYVQCGYRTLRGEMLLAGQDAMEHLQLGEAWNDPVVKSTALLNAASIWHFRGEFGAARAYAERLLKSYDPEHNAAFAMISPQDPRSAGLIRASTSLSCLGLLDQGQMRRDEAFENARQHGHALTLALVFAVACDRDTSARSDPVQVLACAEALQAHCVEHGLPYFATFATVHRGSAISELGSSEEGLALVQEGLAAYRATGALLYLPNFLNLLAHCYRRARQPKEGFRYLDEAAHLIETKQIGAGEAEMYRTRGELLIALGDRKVAEANFLRAIDVARRQDAKLFELKAACSLALLWRDQHKPRAARDLLRPIYIWFTEGFDAPDLKDAKALLNELA